MKFSYGRNEFYDKNRAQSYTYLLSNGLGGYSSASIVQSLTRNDHALLMAGVCAPSVRYHMISKVEEYLIIDGISYDLSSQEYVDYTKNTSGEQYLVNVTKEVLPQWNYVVDGVEVYKKMVVPHYKNAVGLSYEIHTHGNHKVELQVIPCVQFVEKGSMLRNSQSFVMLEDKIMSNEMCVYIKALHSHATCYPTEYIEDVYYAHDARDGRVAYGCYAKGITYTFDVTTHPYVEFLCSMEGIEESVQELIEQEERRLEMLVVQSCAKEALTKSLVRAADQFVVKRESIHSLTLIAGYPFFTDWGRDTMIALEGCCIATKRFTETKEILRTFVTYVKDGIMPNLFPEGDMPPQYNTVDASLWFLQAMHVYYEASQDIAFVKEMYPAMQDIIKWYKQGTAFDIYMDADGLIHAGSGLHQLTWMDVRFEDILPTPRHGKPVEINALWYSGLCTLAFFGELLNIDVAEYKTLAEHVKASFQKAFWNEQRQCLKDVVSSDGDNEQLRCNQIWAVSVPYSPLRDEQAKAVVESVYRYLYTPYGLRTLEMQDPQFSPTYGGSLQSRDLSYHQGTVWTFPLGGYFKAYLKVHHNSEDAKSVVRRQLSYFVDCLREGCVGSIAEIYDGVDPSISKGCFAQGWSVGEILKIMLEVES